MLLLHLEVPMFSLYEKNGKLLSDLTRVMKNLSISLTENSYLPMRCAGF